MQFNYFGCTTTDIVNSYKHSDVTDYGGDSVIQSELEMAEAEIVEKLSKKVISSLNQIEYMEIPQISGSDFTPIFPILQDVYIWQVPRFNPGLSSIMEITTFSCGCKPCKTISDWQDLDSSYIFSDYSISGSNITFGPTFNQDGYTYYISYTVDKTQLIIPSLKAMIRDRVACVLGMQLYTRQDDTWKLVDLYCKRADKILSKDYIPGELKSFKFLNPLTQASLNIVPLRRA